MADRIRVVLCDDHAVVRTGLRRILEEEDDIEVVGEAGSCAEVEQLARDERPDVVLMDLGLPDGNGIDATAKVRSASPATHVLILSAHDDVAYLERSFEAGALGYLLKESADLELGLAVRRVSAGQEYVHPRLREALVTGEHDARRPGGPGGDLSDREVEVLRLVALGHTNAEVAETLKVSVRTVETHRAHLQQKLGSKARADLVRSAREFGLLRPSDDL